MIRLLTLLLLSLSVSLTADEPVGKEKDERQEQLRFMRARAEEFKLARVDADEAPLTLSDKAILRYSNPERDLGSTDGVTYLWLDGQRPIAVSSFSIRRPNDSGRCEFTTFSDKPLRCTKQETELWRPDVPESLRTPLDVEPPTDSATRRLFQMKALSRQFEATCFHPRSKEATRLRLLDRPLYRYEDRKTGVLDGCLFAFAVSNDPELLILIEAIQNEGEPPSWVYSIGPMTSWAQTVNLNDEQVWESPNYYRSGKPLESPYFEGGVGDFIAGETGK